MCLDSAQTEILVFKGVTFYLNYCRDSQAPGFVHLFLITLQPPVVRGESFYEAHFLELEPDYLQPLLLRSEGECAKKGLSRYLFDRICQETRRKLRSSALRLEFAELQNAEDTLREDGQQLWERFKQKGDASPSGRRYYWKPEALLRLQLSKGEDPRLTQLKGVPQKPDSAFNSSESGF